MITPYPSLFLRRALHLRHKGFWRKCPAFLTSLTLLIGISSTLFFHHPLWLILFGAYLIFIRSYFQLLLLFGAAYFGVCHEIPITPPAQEIEAVFTPKTLKTDLSFNKRAYVYIGTLLYDSKKLPCTIYLRKKLKERPLANQKYRVKGTLQLRSPLNYSFKTTEWTPIKGSWSFAEMRYKIKTKVKKLISSKIRRTKTAQFISALFTGDIEDKLLRHELGRVGLQHILAVSGFHFGMILAFFTFLLQIFLTRTTKIAALLCIISSYFLFIGPSPSVERSYVTALLYLAGTLFNRNISPLNLLGCALSIELICNPMIASHIGFQLSFLSCAAILIFYPLIERKMRYILPKRTPYEVRLLNLASQHGHIISTYLRQTLSLCMAVNLVLIPLLLHHFHQFPMLSFIYNLFFPLLVTVSLFLFLMSSIFHLMFPPLANLLFKCLEFFTTTLLHTVENPPFAIDFVLRTTEVAVSGIMIYLSTLLFWRISIADEL